MASLSAQEKRLAETLASPLRWGQAYLANRDGSPREYWPHQREDLLCPGRNIIHLDGRAVGKCLAGDTLITDCTTGERIRIDHLAAGRAIAVLGPDQKIRTCERYEVLANGRKACWKLTTRSGRTIRATANHPFLTDGGWVPLERLRAGDWIAVTKHHPVHVPENPKVSDDELKLLAYFIADGGIAHASAVFTKTEPILVDEFRQCALRLFPGIQVVPADDISYRVTKGRRGWRNPCIEWLRGHDLMGKKSKEKFLPDVLFTCSQRQLAVFLSRLFGCDGWFHVRTGGQPTIGYCSASLRLAEGLQHALLRFGIQSDLRVKPVNGVDYWCVDIRTLSHVQRFGRLIGMVGMKGVELEAILDTAPEDAHNPWDVIPAPLVRPIIDHLKRRFTWNQITGNENRRIRLHRYNPTRTLVAEYAANCESAELHELASSDVHWDKVADIEYAGEVETFDLSVPGFRNFVANDIIVHNSINLSTQVLHFAFTTRGGQGLIAAPHQGHLDTVIEEIEFQLDHNDDLMNSIAMTKYGKKKIHRKPYFRLEFTNGSILYFRPAGAYGDAFRSLHVDRIWVDEAAWLSEKAWKALRQCLNPDGTLRIYSTPNGLRNTTYYRLTLSEQFTVFRWPSWLNPLWNDEREAELLEFYGGRDTSGWQHEVAGEHGKPSYGAFNVEQFNLCRQDILEYRKIVITDSELRDCADEETAHDRLEMLLNLTPQTGVFWVGGDLGYTNDPTELVVFHEVEAGERKVLRLVLRLHLEHVAYPHIAQTLALLERYYTPMGMGVDNGGNGLAVVQELLTLDKYKELGLEGRLKGYDFGGMTRLAVRDGREVKKRTKELMTSLINGALQRKQLVLPAEDTDIEDQFTTHTYTLRDGKVVYSKGNDHIIDAIRCALLIREEESLDQSDDEVVSLKPVLTDPVFV